MSENIVANCSLIHMGSHKRVRPVHEAFCPRASVRAQNKVRLSATVARHSQLSETSVFSRSAVHYVNAR